MRGLLVTGCVLLATVAHGETVILSDRGGPLTTRIAQIEHYRLTGEPVMIDGFCASACTMLLAVACVTDTSVLAFHGPSTNIHGLGLSPDDFEYWSRIMSSYYPPAISAVFMSHWRYDTIGAVEISGKSAIKLGATPCQE